MTVTPKVDPRKDRRPRKAGARLAATYTLWAIAALCAIGAAGSVFIWREGRAPVPYSPVVVQAPAPQVVANPNAEREIGRLNDAVRVLASERDRLATRLDQLERSVGDITASIPQRPKEAPPANEEPLPPPSAPPVQVVTPPNPAPRPQTTAPPPQAPQTTTQVTPAMPQVAATETPNSNAELPTTTRTVFAIDLGGEKTVDGLRARWATLRGNHGASLDGLRPLISVKEGQKSGTVELRLVVGPIPNAAAAARVCAKLQTSGVPCIPTVFDGQRLSLR